MTELERLETILGSWIARFKAREAAVWSARGLAAGLALALVAGYFAQSNALVVEEEFWLLASAFALVGTSLGCALALLRGRSRISYARFFDRRLHLKERTSTALELAAETAATSELQEKQLQNALREAEQVDIRKALPLIFPRVELLLSLTLGASLLFLYFYAQPQFLQAQSNRMIAKAIQQEEQAVADLLEQITQSEEFTPEQKEALSEPLEQALQELQQAGTLEEALAALREAQQGLAQLQSRELQERLNALRAAGESLREQEGLEQFAEGLAEGNPTEAGEALQSLDLDAMTAVEREELAQELRAAASTVEAVDPQLAEQLREAAQALQEGRVMEAQAALEAAAQTLSEVGTQAELAQAVQAIQGQLQQGESELVAGANAQQAGQDNAQGASGAGRGEAQQPSGTGREVSGEPIAQDNAPGNAGERPYEEIYSPERLGGEGGDPVTLPGSGEPGETIVGEDAAAPGSPGDSRIPYTEVLGEYQDAANRAIETGRVPLHLRSLIRDYFSSLDPNN